MAHLALYRKYRSKTFEEIVGQQHIVKSLINQITTDSISHAYLFTGTRGTGKTSIAKIFAKAINCEEPLKGSPCGKCKICVANSDPSCIDILEIDAASNNGVDEIRDLREKVKYPPINGKYKVYIIDEVHMLTTSAFNALLKTLEEPPTHVVFILATTDVQKLPATILSRCMRFDFKLIPLDELTKHLKKVFDDSKIGYENEALELIASLGEGSVRDMLSIADMCVAYSGGNVSYANVVEAVGVTDKRTLHNLAKNILLGEVGDLLSEINRVANLGKNMAQLSKDIISYFRDLLVINTCKNPNEILKYPEDLFQDMTKISKLGEQGKMLKVLEDLSSLDNDFRYCQSPRTLLEIHLLSLCKD